MSPKFGVHRYNSYIENTIDFIASEHVLNILFIKKAHYFFVVFVGNSVHISHTFLVVTRSYITAQSNTGYLYIISNILTSKSMEIFVSALIFTLPYYRCSMPLRILHIVQSNSIHIWVRCSAYAQTHGLIHRFIPKECMSQMDNHIPKPILWNGKVLHGWWFD